MSEQCLPVYPPLVHLLLRTAQDRGRRQEDRRCHPCFTDLGSMRDHSVACFISQTEKSTEENLAPGQETKAQRDSGVCPVTDWEESPRLLVLLSHACSESCMASLGTGLRGEGWWMGVWPSQAPGLQTSHRRLGRQQLLQPLVHIHVFTFLAMIHICEDFQGVQSEGGGEPPDGHGQTGEFLKGVWPIF